MSLQEKLFIPLQSKSLFYFLWTILVAYMWQVFEWLMDIKERFGCQQTQIFSMYGFSTLTKAFQDQSTLFARCSWTKAWCNWSHNIVTIPFSFHISLHQFWLVVLVFYGPSTHFRSFQARSVNLVTLFLGKPPG